MTDITLDEFRKEILWECYSTGTQDDYAKARGINPASLSLFLNGTREPSPDMVKKLGYIEKITRTYKVDKRSRRYKKNTPKKEIGNQG